MKLTPVVNFTIILQAAFSNESVLRSFSPITVWVKNIGAKATHKMLLKLTIGLRN